MGIIKNYQSKGTCKVTFTHPVHAVQGAKTIQVLGEFNNWDSSKAPKMKKGKEEFSVVIEINAGKTYEFRYLIDNVRWDNDFAADGYVPSPYSGVNNSLLILDAVAPVVAEKKASAKSTKVEKANSETKKTSKPSIAKTNIVADDTITKKIISTSTSTKAAVKSQKDDLKKIEGIGPKIAEILNSKGIVTFADLAKSKVEQLKKILEEAGPKFNIHDPATWPSQAKLASTGKWDELKKLQEELNAGKVKK